MRPTVEEQLQGTCRVLEKVVAPCVTDAYARTMLGGLIANLRMWGKSERELPQKDWRFADPAWKDNPLYNRLAQGYLAFCESVDKVVEDNPDWKKRERAKFLTGILTSAMIALCRKSPPIPPYSSGTLQQRRPVCPALIHSSRGVRPAFSHAA